MDAAPDTVWNTGAKPWKPEARSWEQPEQHWSACEGRPSWDIWQSTVHGADAAAGGGADWNGASWKDAAQSSCEDAAQRFCVWCGKPVPPNLVQAKFCTFCGKPHSGSVISSASSGATRRKSAVKAHLTDDKWDSMTPSERILALVKTRSDTGSGVPLQVQ
jgi:hypothetical protein